MIDIERKEYVNRVEINGRREGIGTINIINLSKVTSSQRSLVTCNGTINMIFEG